MTDTPKWALRRSPTVHFEGPFIGPDKWNRIAAVHDGNMIVWDDLGHVMGGYREDFDLVPLQTPPKKALQCWVNVTPDGDFWWAHKSKEEALDTESSQPIQAVPMIERAPGDALAEAVRERISAAEPELANALRTYEEATK